MAALHVPLALAALLAASPSPSQVATPAATAPTLPILDGLVVVVLLIALWVGYQRGLIQPLMTQAFFFISLLLIYRDRVSFLNAVQHYGHGNIAMAVFAALIVAVVAGYIGSVVGSALHRMPVARGIDGFLGVFVNVAIWMAVFYYVLCALVIFDRAFTPFVNQAQLTNQQVAYLTTTIQSNPLAAALVDPKDLKALKDQTQGNKTAGFAAVTQLENLKNVYEDIVRPQVRGSRIAPVIMRFGHALHLSKFSEKDLPK